MGYTRDRIIAYTAQYLGERPSEEEFALVGLDPADERKRLEFAVFWKATQLLLCDWAFAEAFPQRVDEIRELLNSLLEHAYRDKPHAWQAMEDVIDELESVATMEPDDDTPGEAFGALALHLVDALGIEGHLRIAYDLVFRYLATMHKALALTCLNDLPFRREEFLERRIAAKRFQIGFAVE